MRATTLRALAAEPRTMVFVESPNRLAASRAAMADEFGADRRVVVCRELTKQFEEARRGTAAAICTGRRWRRRGGRSQDGRVAGFVRPTSRSQR